MNDTEIVETTPEPDETLAAHEEAFAPDAGPPVPEPEATPEPAAPKRHRARSQQAGTEDVDAIAKWTKELRDAEAKIEIARNEGESERVYQLRRRAEIATRAHQPAKPTTPTPPPAPQPVAKPAPTSPVTFSEVEPKLEDFATQPDPYGALVRAQAAFDRRKDTFEAQQTQAKQAQEGAQQARQTAWVEWVKTQQAAHNTRFGAFIAANPAARDLFASLPGDLYLSHVMQAAIELHEQGPAMMYYLAQPQNRDFADELLLDTDGKGVVDSEQRFNPLVATVQRRLLQRVQAATTGSAAPARPTLVAPRPPNPVRTAPQTPSDAWPDESSSLAAHEAAFGGSRRRR